MESKPSHRVVHACGCPDCQQGRRSDIIEEHRAINRLIALLDEKRRRLFAGFWATISGRGGVARLAVITGLSRTTILRGRREFLHPEGLDPSRIRKPGGGRKRVEKKPWRSPVGAPVPRSSGLVPAFRQRSLGQHAIPPPRLEFAVASRGFQHGQGQHPLR